METIKKLIIAGLIALGVLNVHAQTWNLTGNASTNPPTHFLELLIIRI